MSSKKVIDAVIPAAGRGTRMQSVTRGKPKELLPVNGIPIIGHTIQEAIDAGIEKIYIIISPDKQAIREYLESKADFRIGESRVKFKNLEKSGIYCTFLNQAEPLGLANALSLSESDISGNDFLALMPDTLFPEHPSPSVQLINNYNSGRCCMGFMKLSRQDILFYNNTSTVNFETSENKKVIIRSLSEKNYCDETGDSKKYSYRTGGGMIYSKDFFQIYHELRRPDISDFDDVPILRELITRGLMDGCLIKGVGFDLGSPTGYKAALEYVSNNSQELLSI